MNQKLGVMQGRLLPKYKGRFQAHPVNLWQKEFPIARSLGLRNIEFILDFEGSSDNPLMTSSGKREILELSKNHNIEVKSICADYFMDAPFHSENDKISKGSINLLKKLVSNAKDLNVTNIVIPCVDKSSISKKKDLYNFLKCMEPITQFLEDQKINICLETDLEPKKFKTLLEDLNSKIFKVNYDIGNSASMGFDPFEEFNSYGDLITDVHIKDRKFQGKSIFLGKGDAKIFECLNYFKKVNYQGLFILQAYRDNLGLEIFKKQLMWLRENFELN